MRLIDANNLTKETEKSMKNNHHKNNQMCGSDEEYKKWIDKYEEPLEDGDYYSWNKGINP